MDGGLSDGEGAVAGGCDAEEDKEKGRRCVVCKSDSVRCGWNSRQPRPNQKLYFYFQD